jgi:signal transduction histidine kinase
VGTVGINRDVTSMKKAEEELRAANAELARSEAELQKALNELQKAHNDLRAAQLQLVEAEKLQTVGRLAAGVAHEVKNPLAVTLRGIDYLSKVLVSKDAAVSTVLHDMQDAIRRADNVIRGMLDFAAPREIDAAPQDVNNIIERALQLVKHDLDRYRVFVDKVLDPRLPRCRLDRQKAQEVFLNIFENAIHAMPSGGTLTVRTYRKTLTGLGTNVGDSKIYRFKMGETIVVVEVEDTGVGIPADKLDKLFDPFFTTKPAGQGTGLGLSVSKTIVELHGGTIDIRNRPEGGARVVVMFKADKESEVAAGRA